MPGLVEELLELESAKHRALLACDADAYEKHVRRQLHVLSETPDVRQAAAMSPDQVRVLSRLIQLNACLLHNHFASSPVFALNGALGKSGYTSEGALETRPPSNFSVEV
jgi:hypothetical protein